MNEYFAVRIGSRFVFVNVLPALFLVAVVGGFVAAGAPSSAPTWQQFIISISRLGGIGATLLAFALVAVSVVMHPLSYPLIQILEGHWEGLPMGTAAKRLASTRYLAWRADLKRLGRADPRSPQLAEGMWLPDLPRDVLPTSLGNTLRAGERRAGRRYGYNTAVGLRLIIHVMSPSIRVEVTDTRNQLDTAARMCVVGLLAVPATTALLWSHRVWLLVPLGCYLLAWAAYRASVAAARRFCDAITVAFDLHHLQMWDALSLQRPKDVSDEKQTLAPLLTRLLQGSSGLLAEEMARFKYLSAPQGEQTPPPT